MHTAGLDGLRLVIAAASIGCCLGIAQTAANNTGDDNKVVKTSSVHIRLMENSLAARDAASPQGAASTTGAERP